MPRRSILSVTERTNLLALPNNKDDLIRHYTFNEAELSVIRQHRGSVNRLGIAVQLCYMRYPGVVLGVNDEPPISLLRQVATQLNVPIEIWHEYGQRKQTRREHLVELKKVFNFKAFTTANHYQSALQSLDDLAWQTDKGIALAIALIDGLRCKRILLPSLDVIERICAEAITCANRRIYRTLAEPLSISHQQRLEGLLQRRDNAGLTWLAWLRQAPSKPNSRHML